MSDRAQAKRNILTDEGLAYLRRQLRIINKLATDFGLKEVAFHVGVAELAMIDARAAMVPYRGDLLAEIERPQPEMPDA